MVLLVLQGVMATELVFLLSEGLWASGFWLLAVMAVTCAPAVLGGLGVAMKRDRRSFIEIWIGKFIKRNPRLFRN